MAKAYFITSTGTDIGKTIATCALVKQLRERGQNVMAIKPVISGWDESSANDTLQILTALGLPHDQDNINKISPWRFKAPLAASMAARLENREIKYQEIIDFCRAPDRDYDILLIEGAGGVMAPITDNKTNLDLIHDLNIPAILVTGTYLGAISHTLTAIKAMESEGVEIGFIIVNESENSIGMQDTISELKNFIDYEICGISRVKPQNGFAWEYVSGLEKCI